MKKVMIFLVVFFIISTGLIAQTQVIESTQDPNAPYRLFKTQNIWTFIELETATGKMWILQYSVEDNERGGVILNDKNLAENKKKIDGRFTLYYTSNMWNFILLDQITGSTWQVQWSFNKDEQFIMPLF